MEASAYEQSAWIDYLIPRLLNRADKTPELFDTFSFGLRHVQEPAPRRATPIQKTINDVVAKAGRLGLNPDQFAPEIYRLQASGIVATEVTFPAADLSHRITQGPLTICVWTCPSRETALVLAWLRNHAIWQLSSDPDIDPTKIHRDEGRIQRLWATNAPGEICFWFRPRLAFNGVQHLRSPRIHPDRISFLRGTSLVEISTYVLTYSERTPGWYFFGLGDQVESQMIDIAMKLDQAISAED